MVSKFIATPQRKNNNLKRDKDTLPDDENEEIFGVLFNKNRLGNIGNMSCEWWRGYDEFDD